MCVIHVRFIKLGMRSHKHEYESGNVQVPV